MQETEFRSGVVKATECVTEGFELIKPRYWLFFAIVLIQTLLSFATNYVPYIGGLLSTAVSASLLCGVYLTMLSQARGARPDLALLFEGLSRFLPAFAVTLMTTIPWFLLSVALVLIGPSLGIDLEALAKFGAEPNFELIQGMLGPLFLLFLAAFLLSVPFEVLLYFTLQLIADRNLGAIEAVRLSVAAAVKNLGGLILLFILEILLVIGGLLIFGVGIFFTLPIMRAAQLTAYRKVFPDLNARGHNDASEPEFYEDQIK